MVVPLIELKWSRPQVHQPTRAVFTSSKDNLLVGDRGGNLACWDPGGRRAWRKQYGAEVTGIGATPRSEGAIIGTQDRYLRRVNGQGEQIWERTLGGGVWSLHIAAENQRLIVGQGRGLTAQDVDGTPLWEDMHGQTVVSVTSSATAHRVVACADGNLLGYDEQGQPLWKDWFSEPLWSASMTGKGDHLVVGAMSGELCYYDGLGRRLWEKELPSQVQGVCIDDSGQLIVAGCHDGILRLYNNQGEQLLEHRVGAKINSVALSPDMTRVACTTHEENQLMLFRVTGLGLEGIQRPVGATSSTETGSGPVTVAPTTGSAEPDSLAPSDPRNETAEEEYHPFSMFDAFSPSATDGATATEPVCPADSGSGVTSTSSLTGSGEHGLPTADEVLGSLGMESPAGQPSHKESAFARFSEEVEERSLTDQLRLGNAAFDEGRFKTAVTHYRNATLAAPREPRTWFNLAIACHHAGDALNAVKALQKVLKLDPTYEPARKAVPLFAQQYAKLEEQ